MRFFALLFSFALITGCPRTTTATATGTAPAMNTADEHAGHTMTAPSTTAATLTNQNFPSAAGEASGYLATPKTSGRHPALIVIQEWWGLNDWIRQSTDRFASQGYVSLAVDLYRGHSTSDPNEAHELMRGLPEDRALSDLQGAFNYLAARPDVDPGRIGVIGWCMGGGYALNLTVAQPMLAASVVNYGHLATDEASLKAIHAPLMGHFGATDRGIPAADVEAFAAKLKSLGKEADVKVFPGVGHAFMNPNNREGYSAAAADEAWKRIDAFLAAHLKP